MFDSTDRSVTLIWLLVGAAVVLAIGLGLSFQQGLDTEAIPAVQFEVGSVNPTVMLGEDGQYMAARIDILCVEGQTVYIVRTPGSVTPVSIAATGHHPGHCGIE